jgi:glycerol-3-phosphate acyltransferase PlsY
MSMAAVLLILLGYLLGSIPTAYLAGQWLRGRDLRRYGSGTVSGSMVWEHVARWAIVPVGVFDLAKAAFPAWLALRMDLGWATSAAAGLAAVAGHNWSVFFHFAGGRGLSPFLGLLLVLFPWGFPWMLAFLAVGWLLGDSAPWTLVALISLPVFAHLIDGPGIVAPASATMLLLTLAKRVEANRQRLPAPGPERRRVLLRRLFLDRDIRSHEEWIRRQPEGPPPSRTAAD